MMTPLELRCKYVCTPISGIWSSPTFKGPRPPPCADISLISIDHYRAVLYGGRRGTDGDSKDLYIIDFNAKVYLLNLLVKPVSSLSLSGDNQGTTKQKR